MLKIYLLAESIVLFITSLFINGLIDKEVRGRNRGLFGLRKESSMEESVRLSTLLL